MQADKLSAESSSLAGNNNSVRTDMLLELLCKGDETGFIKILLQSETDANTKRLLNAVTKRSNEDIVELLVDAGAKVNLRRTPLQWTPLHLAARHGACINVVQSLIDQGADMNVRDSYDGNTPLHVAIVNTHKDIAELLIRSGADINLCDDVRWTPLHYASRYGGTEVAQSLIRKGADLDARNSSYGNTPLHVAIVNAHKDTAELLIRCGADINLCDDKNWTPLYLASRYGCAEVAQTLINKGADLNARESYDGNTPLHVAIASRHIDIAELLVSSGADINLRNAKTSRTPFSYVILSGCNAEVVKFFIENGAYVEPTVYTRMMENSALKASILQDIKICSQAIVNKFNYLDLPELYNLPMAFIKRLPPIGKLKIVLNRGGITRDIERVVAQKIGAKGHCNLMEVCPLPLSFYCVASLITYFDGIKQLDINPLSVN